MYKSLINKAREARKGAYAPYSGITVGAALLCHDGTVFTGCNIENAAYSPSLCAERTAFAKAISSNFRKFEAIAICGGDKTNELSLFYPCGVCRQWMQEFCDKTFKIIVVDDNGSIVIYTLDELLPYAFSL